MERLLIETNEGNAKKQLDTIERLIPRIDILIHRYMELNLGDFSHDLLMDAVFDDCKQIRESYYNQLCCDLDKIANITLRKKLQKMGDTWDNPFVDELTIIKSWITMGGDAFKQSALKYISIEDNQCLILDSAKVELIESNKQYLEDPNEINLYHLHKAAVESLQKFYAACNGSKPGFHIVFNCSLGTEISFRPLGYKQLIKG